MAEQDSLPVVIPGRLLISPGIWNKNEYSAKEIGEGFARTDWGDKQKVSLWLNHDDRNAGAFVGYVKNPTLASQGRVFGDLEIWDEKTAVLLTKAMAKFGISAKIKGEEDSSGKMKNFTFENFSVVTVPACSEAYINLAEDPEKNLATQLKSVYLTASNLEQLERRLIDTNMAEELKNEEKQEETAVVEEKTEEVEEELSEKDMLKSLCEKFDKLVALLSKKEEPEEEEEKKEEVKENEQVAPAIEENKELISVKKELAEIKEKLNAPKSKTIRNLSSNVEDTKYSVNDFCSLLENIDKPMKFN